MNFDYKSCYRLLTQYIQILLVYQHIFYRIQGQYTLLYRKSDIKKHMCLLVVPLHPRWKIAIEFRNITIEYFIN